MKINNAKIDFITLDMKQRVYCFSHTLYIIIRSNEIIQFQKLWQYYKTANNIVDENTQQFISFLIFLQFEKDFVKLVINVFRFSTFNRFKIEIKCKIFDDLVITKDFL